jgi:hypothetical protein
MYLNENVIRWMLGLCLNLLLAFVLFRNRVYRRLPVFGVYLLVVIVCDFLSSGMRLLFPVRSAPIFYEFWTGQAVMIGTRAAAVGEICFQILSPYRGIWKLCRMFLAGVAVVLLGCAAYSAHGQPHLMTPFIMVLQRGLELAIVGTLAFALVFATYYELKIPRFLMLITGGLLFYSAVQIANSQFMSTLRGPYHEAYAALSLFSFNIASVIWVFALWKPLPAMEAAPMPSEIGVTAPEVHARLRELNARLSEILR